MTNVVYVIECTKCTIQYVEDMENVLHIQMNGHWLDIKNRHLERNIAKDFNTTDHFLEDLSIFLFEKIHRADSNFQKAKESYWIWTLRSLTPEGINLDP